MDNVIGIAITALLGIAGIASTHLLARSQRAADDKRLRTERKERYRFARYETVAQLCGEFVGELRALESKATLRALIASSIARELRAIPAQAKEDAETVTDPKLAEHLRAFAQRFDSDPSAADDYVSKRLKNPHDPNIMPPLPETTVIITRLSDLSAQLQIQGGSAIATAAERARAAASATLFQLELLESRGYNEPLDTERLTLAIKEFISAAIFELRIKPHDRNANFDDLMERYKQEAQTQNGPDAEKGE